MICGTGERAIGDSLHAIEPGEVILLGSNLPHVWRLMKWIDPALASRRWRSTSRSTAWEPAFRSPRASRCSPAARGRARDCRFGRRDAEAAGRPARVAALCGTASDGCCNSCRSSMRWRWLAKVVCTLSSSIPQPFAAELEQERLPARSSILLPAIFREGIHRDAAADLACTQPEAPSAAFSRLYRNELQRLRRRCPCGTCLPGCSFNPDSDQRHRPPLRIRGPQHVQSPFRKRREMSPTEYRRRMLTILSRIGDPTQITRIRTVVSPGVAAAGSSTPHLCRTGAHR